MKLFDVYPLFDIEIAQGFLQRHGIDFAEPARFFTALHLRHQTSGFLVVDPVVIRFPLVAAQSQEMIVEKTAASECTVYQHLLRLVWVGVGGDPQFGGMGMPKMITAQIE